MAYMTLEEVESTAMNQAAWIHLCLGHGNVFEGVDNMVLYDGNAGLYQLKTIRELLEGWNDDLEFYGEPGLSEALEVRKRSTGGVFSFLL